MAGFIRTFGIGTGVSSPLLTDLAFWFDFEETGTSNRVDSHNGYDFDDVTGTSSDPTGRVGNGFGGSTLQAEMTTTPIPDFTDDWTICHWFNQASSFATLWRLMNASSQDVGQAFVNSATSHQFRVTNTGFSEYTVTESGTYALGSPHCMMCWLDQGAGLIYISMDNNTPVSTSFAGTIRNGPYQLNLGQSPNTTYRDILAGWSRILTADERTEFYNSGSGMSYPG